MVLPLLGCLAQYVHSSSLFLCVCASTPTQTCTSLSRSVFSLVQHIASAAPALPPLHFPLFVTWVPSYLGCNSPGFLSFIISIPTPLCLLSQIEPQVGIIVDPHLNRVSLQSAVCNSASAHSEVLPPFAFVYSSLKVLILILT